jgi:hypothetical protein
MGHFPEFLAARVDSSPVVGIVSLRTTPRGQIFGKGPLSSASNPQTAASPRRYEEMNESEEPTIDIFE